MTLFLTMPFYVQYQCLQILGKMILLSWVFLTDYSTGPVFVKEIEDAEGITAVQSSGFRVQSAGGMERLCSLTGNGGATTLCPEACLFYGSFTIYPRLCPSVSARCAARSVATASIFPPRSSFIRSIFSASIWCPSATSCSLC